MLKKLILLGILLMLGSDVFAAAYLVSPAEKTISDGGITEIGGIAPGETAELFFKKRDQGNQLNIEMEKLQDVLELLSASIDREIVDRVLQRHNERSAIALMQAIKELIR